ncbi:unnamed protein product [Brassica rapa subsp. trilocularis]
MEQIRFRDVVRTIAVVFLLVIAEQATAGSIDYADCYGLCNPHCEQTCKGLGYTAWLCPLVQTKSFCCCTPKKKKNGHSVQLNN